MLTLPRRMAEDTRAQIKDLPPATIADRFYQLMQTRLEQSAPHRETLAALFCAALNPESGAGLHEGVGDLRAAFRALVDGASDAPRTTAQADQLATLLAGVYGALILFWLYDHSPDQAVARELLEFVRDTLAMARPALIFPPLARSLERLAGIAQAALAQE